MTLGDYQDLFHQNLFGLVENLLSFHTEKSDPTEQQVYEPLPMISHGSTSGPWSHASQVMQYKSLPPHRLQFPQHRGSVNSKAILLLHPNS